MAKKKTQPKPEVVLMSVKEYAATRKGWRNQPVSPAYIYRLIDAFNAGKKTKEQIGFIPHLHGKGYKIESLTQNSPA